MGADTDPAGGTETVAESVGSVIGLPDLVIMEIDGVDGILGVLGMEG